MRGKGPPVYRVGGLRSFGYGRITRHSEGAAPDGLSTEAASELCTSRRLTRRELFDTSRWCLRALRKTHPQNPSAGVRPTKGVKLSLATRPSILAGESSVT
jgi:hypothetical protein